MAAHNELGKEGEHLAATYLTEKGYCILHRNWFAGKRDLDIVAQKGNELIIVEVKTRRNNLFGIPSDALTNRKIHNIISATDAYIKQYQIDIPVRFDVITIIGSHPPYQIEHIPNAFLPPLWE